MSGVMPVQHNGDDTILTLFVVYASPKDFPAAFVVRQQAVMRDGTVWPYADCTICESLEAARDYCQSRGLTNIGRYDNDDPVIVEVWI